MTVQPFSTIPYSYYNSQIEGTKRENHISEQAQNQRSTAKKISFATALVFATINFPFKSFVLGKAIYNHIKMDGPSECLGWKLASRVAGVIGGLIFGPLVSLFGGSLVGVYIAAEGGIDAGKQTDYNKPTFIESKITAHYFNVIDTNT